MPAKTVTTREFVCDNCGEGDVFDHDADAGRAGWALVNVNGKQFALCPEHHQELKDLLMVSTRSLHRGRPNVMTRVPPQPTAPPEARLTVRTAMAWLTEANRLLEGQEQ